MGVGKEDSSAGPAPGGEGVFRTRLRAAFNARPV